MEKIEWFKPQAYKTLTNSEGMEIMLSECSTEVYYRFTDDITAYDSFVRYNENGDAYFMERYTDSVHYLNEFIKIQ